jgi:hypothetical protein
MPNKAVKKQEDQETSSEKAELGFVRNEKGLLEGKKYQFTDDGLVDWRKMIDSKFLVPNVSKFADNVDTKSLKVEDLEDSQLLILLGGIKNIANIRGYKKVKYKVFNCTPSYVAVSCKITWLPNFETSGQEVEFEALADAHLDNTKSFAKDFLMAIAENRAFVRAVRSFLRINIIGTDELGDSKNGSTPPMEASAENSLSSSHPLTVLKECMSKSGITFEKIKATILKEGNEEAEAWQSINDIPSKMIFSLIQRLKKKIDPQKQEG